MLVLGSSKPLTLVLLNPVGISETARHFPHWKRHKKTDMIYYNLWILAQWLDIQLGQGMIGLLSLTLSFEALLSSDVCPVGKEDLEEVETEARAYSLLLQEVQSSFSMLGGSNWHLEHFCSMVVLTVNQKHTPLLVNWKSSPKPIRWTLSVWECRQQNSSYNSQICKLTYAVSITLLPLLRWKQDREGIKATPTWSTVSFCSPSGRKVYSRTLNYWKEMLQEHSHLYYIFIRAPLPLSGKCSHALLGR